MVKISIIVPVYNVEKYLEKCISSLLNQTLMDIEIICVNDGSIDKSGEILDKLKMKDSRLVVFHKDNEGLSVARNLGVSLAKGEYIGFVDSDDWVDLDYFEKLYNAAKNHNCDVACAGFKRCKKFRSSVRKCFKSEKVYTDINEKVEVDCLPDHNYVWNKIYNREEWLKHGIEFEKGRYFEDLALTVKILYLMGKMVTVPDTYYNYRITPNSIVATVSPKHKEDYNWARSQMLNFVKEKNIKLPKDRKFYKKENIKLFNFTILKIYYFQNVVKYNLLGFIPFIKKEIC